MASPPKFVSFEEIMKAADGVSNMVLAHEIAVNNDFRFHKHESAEGSIDKQVREVMKQAFWDALQEKLRDPPDYSHALVLLAEVKTDLLGVLPSYSNSVRSQIEEVLDLELIEQKADHGALDFHYYAGFVISIMAKLCAPARDKEVAKLKDIQEVIPLFKEIFAVLELMKLDMVNFTISHMRPYIQQQSVEYEKKKFHDFLKTQQENDVDGLTFTRAWLSRNVDRLMQLSTQSSAGATSNTPDSQLRVMSLNTAYTELLDWDDSRVFPETLLMDQARFLDLREKTRWLSLVSSILLVTYNTVGAPIAGIKGLKEKLKDGIAAITKGVPVSELGELKKNVSDYVAKEVVECLEQHGFSKMTESQLDMLKGQVEGVTQTQHPVHQLLKTRLLDFIKDLISRHRPGEVQVPPGYSAVSEEVSHVCGQFLRLTSHNRAVFEEYYTDIIKTALRQSDIHDNAEEG